jgi:hypothetical protein
MKKNKYKPVVINELRSCDVLLGRGHSVSNFQGNINFRRIIFEKSEVYDRIFKREKLKVVEDVIATIESTGGRFVESIDYVTPTYVLVSPERAMAKVYQSFRDARKNNAYNAYKPATLGKTASEPAKKKPKTEQKKNLKAVNVTITVEGLTLFKKVAKVPYKKKEAAEATTTTSAETEEAHRQQQRAARQERRLHREARKAQMQYTTVPTSESFSSPKKKDKKLSPYPLIKKTSPPFKAKAKRRLLKKMPRKQLFRPQKVTPEEKKAKQDPESRESCDCAYCNTY